MPAPRITSLNPWHVVLVFDDSDAMAGKPASDAGAGLSSMIAEMEVIARGSKPYFRVSIISYGATALLLAENMPEREVDVRALPPFRGRSGASNATAGIRAAIEVLTRYPGKPSDYRPYVFFFSCGQTVDPASAFEAATQLKSLVIPAGTPKVAAICLSASQDSQRYREFMRRLASSQDFYIESLASSSDLAKLFPLIGTAASSPHEREGGGGNVILSIDDERPPPEAFESDAARPEPEAVARPALLPPEAKQAAGIQPAGDTRTSLPPGTRVDHLEIMSEIHRSPTSLVYRASNPFTGEAYVLREFFPMRFATRLASTKIHAVQWHKLGWFTEQRKMLSDLRALFAREWELREALAHPGLSLASRRLRANGTLYTSRPFIAADALSELCGPASHTLSIQKVARLYEALLRIVQFLHTKGYIHGNLSPANILMTGNGDPILIDFETVTPLKSAKEPPHFEVSEFSAPEVAAIARSRKPAQLHAGIDLYALAATMHYCLCGIPPQSTAPLALIEDRVRRGTLPWALAAAIGVCLNRDPGHRPKEALEVLALFGDDEFGTLVRPAVSLDAGTADNRSAEARINQTIINL